MSAGPSSGTRNVSSNSTGDMTKREWRIGIDGTLACSKRPTGVEYFARSLLQELVAIEVPGVRWHLYLPPYGDQGLRIPEPVRVRVRPDVNTMIKTPWSVLHTWRDRLDVLYSFGHLLPPAARGRRVITIHDTAYDHFPDCYPAGIPARANAEVRRALGMATRVVVPSEATRQCLIEDYDYVADRIDVIYEGSRAVFTPGTPTALPERVRAAGVHDPFLLCVGRLDRRKNLERVIDAYRMVIRDGVPCGGLVIVGPDDSGSEQVRSRLASGQVAGEKIVTTGYLGEDEIVNLYRAAAVLVYPSMAEGFGLPVLEAFSCGTPVITSNRSSMPEVAGSAALLVDPENTADLAVAMRRLLSEGDLQSRLAAAGLARSREFSWRRSAELLVPALLAAAKGGSPWKSV